MTDRQMKLLGFIRTSNPCHGSKLLDKRDKRNIAGFQRKRWVKRYWNIDKSQWAYELTWIGLEVYDYARGYR